MAFAFLFRGDGKTNLHSPFRCGRGRGEWRLPSAMQQQPSLDAVRSGNDVWLHQNVLSDAKSELAETGGGVGSLGACTFVRPPHCASSRNGYGRHVAVISSLQIVLISATARNHLEAVPNAHTRGTRRTCSRHVELRSFENCFLNLFSPQESQCRTSLLRSPSRDGGSPRKWGR